MREKLLADFFLKFGEENLMSVGIFKDAFKIRNRLEKDIITKYGNHYIFYVLLIDFLAEDIESFFQGEVSWAVKLPFGISPWVCLNRFCDFHNKAVIEKYFCTSSNSGRVSAEFICPECGYAYARLWRTSASFKETKPSILTVGPVTIIKLLEGCLQRKSITELREVLSDSRSIKKYLTSLFGKTDYLQLDSEIIQKKINELREFMNHMRQYIANGDYYSQFANLLSKPVFQTNITDISKKQMYRKKLLNIIQYIGDVPRSHIEALAFNEYRWLLKHDRCWMENNLPAPKNKIFRKKLDFGKLDLELFEKLVEMSKSIYQADPQRRITQYSIINALEKLDRNRVVSYLRKSKLPKCTELLEQLEETEEAYLLRKTPTIVVRLLKSGYKNVTFDSLCSNTNYQKLFQTCSNKLRTQIFELIEKTTKEYNFALVMNKSISSNVYLNDSIGLNQ